MAADDKTKSKIKHTKPGLGQPIEAQKAAPSPGDSSVPDLSPVALDDSAISSEKKKEIRTFGGMKSRHEDNWTRTPNTTGMGAIHVRSFHSKITEDALIYMDQQINEWLDAHPQYEVKFVNSTLGTFSGKIKEPHVICQIWV